MSTQQFSLVRPTRAEHPLRMNSGSHAFADCRHGTGCAIKRRAFSLDSKEFWMFMKWLYWVYRTLFRVRAWLTARVSPMGWGVLWTLAILPMMRLQPEFSLSYQVFLLLLCCMLIAVAWGLRFRALFDVQRSLPPFASVGQSFSYTVSITNRTTSHQRGLSIREVPVVTPKDFAAFKASATTSRRNQSFRMYSSYQTGAPVRGGSQELPPIAPGKSVTVELALTPTRRGLSRFDGIEITSLDPLGLFRGLMIVGMPQDLLILPKRHPIPQLELPGSARYQAGGVAQSSSVGESEEFVALRDYRRGDSTRHIHWKSLAKTGRLIIKEQENEFFVRHALLLDTFPVGGEGLRFEEAVSVAASFACTVDTQETLLDLMFVGAKAFCFTMGRGVGYPEQALEILATVNPCRDKPFETLSQAVFHQTTTLSGCIAVFVEWDPPRQRCVEYLVRCGVPTLVLVVVEPDDPAPQPTELCIEAGVPFHVIRAGNAANDLLAMGGQA